MNAPIILRHSDPPPSVNRAWRKFRGHMVKSAEFRAWDEAAQKSFKAALRKSNVRLPEHCFWSTRIFLPGHVEDRRRIDLDNTNKAIHDAIVHAKLAPDDHYLVESRQTYWEGGYLIIHLREEPIEKWAAILKTSRTIIRRMEKAKISQHSPRLV